MINPNIVMAHWRDRVPKMTLGSFSDVLSSEGGVDAERNGVESGGNRDLKRASPFMPIRSLLTKLGQQGIRGPWDDTLPNGVWDLGELVANYRRRAVGPPPYGMVKAVAVSRHANNGSGMRSLPHTVVIPLGMMGNNNLGVES